MLSSSKFIAVTLSLLGVASASPIARGTCSPNFEGADLIVTNEGSPSWSTPDHAYRVEYSGQWPDSYLIKLSSQHDTVIAATGQYAGSDLTEVPINYNSADPLQIWDVRCDQCSSPGPGKFTTGCTISLHSDSSLCIALDSGNLDLTWCNNQPDQKWDFSKA